MFGQLKTHVRKHVLAIFATKMKASLTFANMFLSLSKYGVVLIPIRVHPNRYQSRSQSLIYSLSFNVIPK